MRVPQFLLTRWVQSSFEVWIKQTVHMSTGHISTRSRPSSVFGLFRVFSIVTSHLRIETNPIAMIDRYVTMMFTAGLIGSCFAQYPVGSSGYDAWKLTQVQHPEQQQQVLEAGAPRGGGPAPCACWLTPDSSYITIANDSMWDASTWNNGDDGSHGPIALPFSFQLYGQSWDTTYININGNVSFGNYMGTYSSTTFPTTGPKLIAPYWADVDLRGIGADMNRVQYKLTPTALYVNWTNVGYYSQNTDKLNSFQLIITDGTDPAVPGGNNVSFCYGSMEWTTGNASGGMNGFGGTPATVGANRGDGVEYLQFGRFDHAGTDWDGAFGGNDGVNWLVDRHFSFSTEDENIPPIFTSIGCDTLEIEVGSSFDFPMMMIAGGVGQTISGMSQCSGIAGYVESQNTSGSTAEIISTLTPTASEIGLHTINYTAQNDAATPLVSTYTVYVKVLDATTGIHGATMASTLSIQPNPAADRATITWPEGQRPSRVEVFSLTGALVLTGTPSSSASSFELDLRSIPDGIYTVRATGATSTATVRLVRSSVR